MLRAYNTILLLFIFLTVLSVEGLAQSEGGNTPPNANAQPNVPPAGYMGLRQQAIEDNMLYSESIFLVSNYSGFYTNTPEEMSLGELLQRGVEGFVNVMLCGTRFIFKKSGWFFFFFYRCTFSYQRVFR